MTPTGKEAASFRTPASPVRLNDLSPYPLQEDVPEIKARLVSAGYTEVAARLKVSV